ncbi:S24/S26 family peptidase [Microbacterium terregens]|uniref:S24/S26 family peptidase n=1 Tax=Microbacterium terregens TaxID=69363 RepID=A0ABV5T443_9MICO
MDGMTGGGRRGQLLRRLRSLAGWLVIVSILAVSVPGPWGPAPVGITVVSGESMLPTYDPQDLLVTWRSGAYPAGTPVVYRIPEGGPGAGMNVVHRVVSVAPDGTHLMQGDNNAAVDPWRPLDSDVRGEVILRIPGGAYALRMVASPLFLAALCGVMLGAAVFIWQRERGGQPPKGPDSPRRDGLSGPRRRSTRTRREPRTAGAGVTLLTSALAVAVLVVPASAAAGSVSSDNLFATTVSGTIPPPAPLVTAVVNVTSSDRQQYCATVTVSTTSPTDITWNATLDHSTPGITDTAYWLAAAPTNLHNSATTVSFDAGAGAWVTKGVSRNAQIKAGAPTTFSYCAPTGAAAPYVDTALNVLIDFSGGQQYCVNVTVSTTSTGWVKWRGTVDHSTPNLTNPLYWLNAVPGFQNVVSQSFDPVTGTWVIAGVGHNAMIKSGTPATFGYCAPVNPSAPLVDAMVSVVPRNTPTVPGGQYCADVTVSTTSTDWIKWRAVLTQATPNITGPNFLLTSRPGNFWDSTSIDFTAGSGTFTWRLSGASYNSVIKAGTPKTFGFCRG